ncbi:hypothetical protein LAZ67_4004088 [Cordylochernes scorpioides]|uniref:Uncharacterized protein n=1 Tax=Cordylochernes scorpioides TaxID=51811 RepID=A0ABY6KFE1_9ARAC|nr:hypothetical protein LAZ67_4004088 [Cordylochernes scorpioides]
MVPIVPAGWWYVWSQLAYGTHGSSWLVVRVVLAGLWYPWFQLAGEGTLTACIRYGWDTIGYTSRSPLVPGTLNRPSYIYDYRLSETWETLRDSRIIHKHMLPVLYGPSYIQEMFGCCQHVLLICHQ